MNASGIICGTAMIVPHQSSFSSATLLQRNPYSRNVGTNAATKIPFGSLTCTTSGCRQYAVAWPDREKGSANRIEEGLAGVRRTICPRAGTNTTHILALSSDEMAEDPLAIVIGPKKLLSPITAAGDVVVGVEVTSRAASRHDIRPDLLGQGQLAVKVDPALPKV